MLDPSSPSQSHVEPEGQPWPVAHRFGRLHLDAARPDATRLGVLDRDSFQLSLDRFTVSPAFLHSAPAGLLGEQLHEQSPAPVTENVHPAQPHHSTNTRLV